MKRIIITGIGFVFAASTAFSADQQNVPVIFPKDHSIVGNKVNLVIDPTSISYFRVVVNENGYPVVDTSTGTHGFQGLRLEPGLNRITVNVLAPDGKDKKKFTTLSSRTVEVFNSDGAFSPVPPDFTAQKFHTWEHESTCAGCHRLEVAEQDRTSNRPEDVFCSICHREIPKDKYIHGPAAVWNCLACHNPELYPAKYAFSAIDPWKISKSTRRVEPIVFTISSAKLFRPSSSLLLSKKKAKEALEGVIRHLKQNPGDKLRIEAHTDNIPPRRYKTKKRKWIGFKSNKSLSRVRARNLASLLRECGVNKRRMITAGMADKLPKASNKTREGREINNRIEMVVYPAGVRVVNSRKLPVLRDRERVVVSAVYSQGPLVKMLRIVERVPKGMQYLKGSGFFRGKAVEPDIKGSKLTWELGDMPSAFAEDLFYVLKKRKGAGEIPLATRVLYRSYDREFSRNFDPNARPEHAKTVMEACLACHADIMSGKFKHGPVEAGYCNLCHDPHASRNRAWLRKPVWELCTTCHVDKGSGVHVIAGFVKGNTHPTRKRRDPARPGKRLSCASCHEPHSADTREMLVYGVKSRSELCGVCHKK